MAANLLAKFDACVQVLFFPPPTFDLHDTNYRCVCLPCGMRVLLVPCGHHLNAPYLTTVDSDNESADIESDNTSDDPAASECMGCACWCNQAAYIAHRIFHVYVHRVACRSVCPLATATCHTLHITYANNSLVCPACSLTTAPPHLQGQPCLMMTPMTPMTARTMRQCVSLNQCTHDLSSTVVSTVVACNKWIARNTCMLA